MAFQGATSLVVTGQVATEGAVNIRPTGS